MDANVKYATFMPDTEGVRIRRDPSEDSPSSGNRGDIPNYGFASYDSSVELITIAEHETCV